MSDITSLRLLRGSKVKNDAYTGGPGELTVNTDNWTLRLHDGLNAGGSYLDNGERFGFGNKDKMATRQMAYPEGSGKEHDMYLGARTGSFIVDGSVLLNGPADSGFDPLPAKAFSLEAAWGNVVPEGYDLPYSGNVDTYLDEDGITWYANNRSLLLYGVEPDGKGGHRPYFYHYGESFGRRSNWAKYYNNENILDTVKEVNGIPKGGIFERGENANGRYYKRADGQIVCSRRIRLTVTTTDINSGSYDGDVQVGTVSLPATMLEADSFQMSVQVPYKSQIVTKAHRVGTAQTAWSGVHFSLINSGDLAAGDEIIIDLYAEGRLW